MKVLIADDEIDLTRALGAILKYSEYEVKIANNGEEALKIAENEKFDILILDVMMPKKTGREVVEELRKKNINTPILMLTAKAETEDKVEGLDKGADDYLTKPCEKDELLARIRALVRKNENRTKKIKIGNVTLDKEENELYSDKASFHLNSKESELMELLVGNQSEKIGEKEIKNRIWGKDENIKIVPMYISYLQNKFEALGANVQIVNNNGYALESIVVK